jgi:hypothetical protein
MVSSVTVPSNFPAIAKEPVRKSLSNPVDSVLHVAGAPIRSFFRRFVRHRGDDVGLFEVVSFGKERLAGEFGEGIGEAVTEIQPGRVAA